MYDRIIVFFKQGNKLERFLKELIFFTLIFAISFIVVYYPVLAANKVFIADPDGLEAYYAMFAYYRTLFKGLVNGGIKNLCTFDFTVSLGRDVTNRLLGLPLDPFYVAALFCPDDKLETLYNIRIISIFYFTGLSFYLYWKRTFDGTEWGIVGSIVYALSSFSMYYIRHPHLVVMMMIFPVFLLAIDRVIDDNKWALLSLVAFVGTYTEIYIFYILTIVALVYVVVKLIYKHYAVQRIVKIVFTGIGAYLVGFIMCAMVWLPKILNTYLTSGRSSASKLVTNYSDFILFSPDYYRDMFTTFFSGTLVLETGIVASFPITLLLAILAVSINSTAKNRSYLRLFQIFTIFALLPIFGFISSGFSNVNGRWSFALAFFAAILISILLEKCEHFDRRIICIFSIETLLYVFLCMHIKEQLRTTYIHTLISAIATVVVMLLWCTKKVGKVACRFLIAFIILASLISMRWYALVDQGYANQFFDSGTSYERFTDTSLKYISWYLDEKPDNSFFRTASNDIGLDTNAATNLFGLNSISGASSVDGLYNNYLVEMENTGMYDATVRFDFDCRSALMELASVKYMSLDEESIRLAPYGFKSVAKISDKKGQVYHILENKQPLPLGYTYDTYITEEEYASLPAINKQEALLQAVLVEDEYKNGFNDNQNMYSSEQLNASIVGGSVQIDGNGNMNVNAKGDYVRLAFHKDSSLAETYLRLTGHDSDNYIWKVDVLCDKVQKSRYFKPSEGLYSTYSEGKLINLGNLDEGDYTLDIYWNEPGLYSIDEFQIWQMRMDNYPSYIQKLSEESLENVTKVQDTIEGDISVSSKKYLCLSIPANNIDGWKAYVDGHETELFIMNRLFMGMILEPGSHHVVLKYREPYLVMSCWISFLGVLLFVGGLIISNNKVRKNRK